MIKGLRKGLTGLQSPTMIYADKDDHRIVLKGTYPIGDKGFYERTQDQIKTFNGEVHFPGLKPPKTEYDDNGVPTSDYTIEPEYERLTALVLMYQYLAIAFDLESQTKYLRNYHFGEAVNYKNHDLSWEKAKHIFREKPFNLLLETFNTARDNYGLETGFISEPAHPKTRTLMTAIERVGNSEIVTRILNEKRNQHAITEAFNTNTEGKDVMLVWDVEHIKGMSELLEQNGYKHFHTEWDTVIPWVKKRTAYGSDEWAKKRERAFSSLLLFKSTTDLIPLAETRKLSFQEQVQEKAEMTPTS